MQRVSAVSTGGTVAAGCGIKAEVYRGKSLKAFLKAKEREYLSQVLRYVEGDKERAAKALKISLATLYRKLPDPSE
jgi:transcriptional regulator with PAS, ATPase and Fis domain